MASKKQRSGELVSFGVTKIDGEYAVFEVRTPADAVEMKILGKNLPHSSAFTLVRRHIVQNFGPGTNFATGRVG